MNTQILKTEEATNRADSSNLTERNESIVENSSAPSAPSCQNGVCMVSWKPQRPVAA